MSSPPHHDSSRLFPSQTEGGSDIQQQQQQQHNVGNIETIGGIDEERNTLYSTISNDGEDTSINTITLSQPKVSEYYSRSQPSENTPLVSPHKKRKNKETRSTLFPSLQLGGLLKSGLYGGLDGITAVFVSVATIYSGNVTMMAVLVIGIAKLFSGALSMGIGDYISSKAELDLIRLERKREMWECENFLKGEKEEMVSIYKEKGLRQEVAGEMVDIMSTNKKAFVDVMMVQELGLKADADPYGPLKNGITNFASFIFFGSIPLIIYIIFTIIQLVGHTTASADKNTIFFIDCGITAVTLCLMGIIKSRFSTQKWYTSMFFTLLVGVVAAGVGYGVAFLIEKVLHLHNV